MHGFHIHLLVWIPTIKSVRECHCEPITAISTLSYELIPVMGVAIWFPITLIKQRLLRLSPRLDLK
jgi:hypothetical protein